MPAQFESPFQWHFHSFHTFFLSPPLSHLTWGSCHYCFYFPTAVSHYNDTLPLPNMFTGTPWTATAHCSQSWLMTGDSISIHCPSLSGSCRAAAVSPPPQFPPGILYSTTSLDVIIVGYHLLLLTVNLPRGKSIGTLPYAPYSFSHKH